MKKNKKKKVLITGGSGVLGSYVKKSLEESLIIAPTHRELDITNLKQVLSYFKKENPEIVIHLAAKTNVDDCEINYKEAFLINSEGTKNIAKASKLANSYMIYVSTAAVFNGKKEIFFEDDTEEPLNIYGKSKLMGEKYMKEIIKDHLIIRAAWLIGGGKNEKKFISYIIDQVNKGVNEIKVVNDKIGTITYAKEMAELIKDFISEKKSGVYHFGSNNSGSRFDIANKVIKILNKKVNLIPVPSSYFSGSFSAPRPEREVIGSKKIKFQSSWDKNLEDYLLKEILT